VLLSSLPALATHAIELVDHVNQSVQRRECAAIRTTLDNTRLASERLPATVRDIQALVADMRVASHDVQEAADDVHGIATDSAPI